MNRKILEYGAHAYGTPLYIFDLDALADEVHRIRACLDQKAELCYAMKANPFLTGSFAELTDRIEVCSMGEFRICRELGIHADRLVISGVLKKEEDLLEILDYCQENSVYTAESMRQLRCLAGWAESHQKTLRVYPRLTSGNQFGMDEETIRHLVQTRAEYPFLKIQGLHFFPGTGKRRQKAIEKELRYLDEFLQNIEQEAQFSFAELEYGPGIGVPYFMDEEIETFSDEGLRMIAETIDGMKWSGRVRLELGRALAARCGCYLTTIRDVKCSRDKNYCIVDGGIHQINYDGQIRGMYQPHVMLLPSENSVTGQEDENSETAADRAWTVCGSLCTANDVLCQITLEKEPEEGDVLVFERTGAYSVTEGMALFLSHELPGIVCYSEKDGWKPARERQELYQWNMWKQTK